MLDDPHAKKYTLLLISSDGGIYLLNNSIQYYKKKKPAVSLAVRWQGARGHHGGTLPTCCPLLS